MPPRGASEGAVASLPPEILRMIIDYLAYNTPSLCACSLTCRSWYDAAAPYLHATLYSTISLQDQKYEWPHPINSAQKLNFLPFVRDVRICFMAGYAGHFSPWMFNPRHSILSKFLSLVNVQSLELHKLNIPSFLPVIQQYFGHMFPTVQTLALKHPLGSKQHILYFVGSFPRLENLIFYDGAFDFWEEKPNSVPIPPSNPPLRGRLVIRDCVPPRFIEEMIRSFGGIRCRHLELHEVYGTRLLLSACAETLQSLRLDPTDPRGEYLGLRRAGFPTNNLVAWHTPQEFDLSQHKSLRSLEVPAITLNREWLDGLLDPPLRLFKYVLETVRSPDSFRLVVNYSEDSFRGIRTSQGPGKPSVLREKMSQEEIEEETSSHRNIFEVLRQARKVRDFSLTLRVTVSALVGEYGVQTLKDTVAAEKVRGGFDEFSHEPVIEYQPCSPSIRFMSVLD